MSKPNLSVVIPVYNDPEGIKSTLNSVVDQHYPSDRYEILVVDNGSTDRTKHVISSIAEEYSNLVTILSEHGKQSSYAARNRGIANAAGKYVAFMDSDMHVDSFWAKSVVDKMSDEKWRYMGCHVEVYRPRKTLISRYGLYTDFSVERSISEDKYAPTCCLVVHHGVFDDVGIFDDRFLSGGDVEFGRRVHEAGISLHYCSDISMYHPARTTISALLSRYWRIGRGVTQLLEMYPNRFGNLGTPVWKSVLPPRPKNFQESVPISTLTTTEIVLFYLLEYLVQLSIAAGRIHEKLQRGNEGFPSHRIGLEK